MESVESQIAEWRAYVASAPGGQRPRRRRARGPPARPDRRPERGRARRRRGVPRRREADGRRRQPSRGSSRASTAAGCGSSCSWRRRRAGARRGRLGRGVRRSRAAAAVAIQIARLAADFPDEEPTWFARNLGLFVLPFLAGVLRAPHGSSTSAAWLLTAAPFALAGARDQRLSRGTPTRTPRCSSRSTCRSCCGSSSPTRTWAARCRRTSGAWTSSASPASGSSTTC